jgi:serine/threonine protein kinase
MAFLKFFRFRLRRRNRVSDRTEKDSGSKIEKIEKIDWDVIQKATMDFSSSRVIGSGGFSTVYLARFVGSPGSGYGAVKIQCSSERLDQVYKQELQILLNLHHPNIVKLIGFCDDRDEGVLVFEYIPNGTLQDKLHGGGAAEEKAAPSVLTWQRRMVVAFQLAEAIEYLHEKCSLHIVHGDVKSSNILLDDDLNCKLCDFGSAKMGFSSTVLPPSPSKMNRMIMGSQGYIDPHDLKTGIASKMNDVYSFGVILLELITGREAFCPETGEKLTSAVSSVLNDENKVMEIIDSKLNSDFVLEEVKIIANLSTRCLSNSPSLRVSASEILTTMKEKIGSISFLRDDEICLNVK